VGAADAVRAGERDHVDGVEPLGGEHGLKLRDVGERRGEVREGIAGVRHLPVVAARGHGEVDGAAAEEEAGVAAGEGDDVGAGNDARAFLLQRLLRRVDDVQAAQAQVGDAEYLRLRVGVVVGLEQNGGVAALDEAVVEEQTDKPCFDAGVGGAHGLPHEGFRAGALVVVVSDTQCRPRGR